MRRVRRSLAAVVLATAMVATMAGPAYAHGVAGVQPSNFRTRVLAIEPAVHGLRIDAVDLGGHLELHNASGRTVVVLGSSGTPWLRAGPGTTIRWHDHRTRWTGASDPPVVQRHPGERHVVQRWTIGLRRGAEPITVRGDVVWVPGPSPLPWLLCAVALTVVVAALGRTRRWRLALASALGAAVVSETVHVVGAWDATTASLAAKLAATGYSLGAIALAAVALALLVGRRDPYDVTPVALLAGLVIALAGGLTDITALSRSQLPTTFPDALTRLEVALALGLGAGIAVVSALRLRRPETRVTS